MVLVKERHPLFACLRCPHHSSPGLLPQTPHVMRCGACGREFSARGRIMDFSPQSSNDAFHAESRQWDEQADSYEQKRATDLMYQAGLAAALRAAGPLEGLRVLDAGCGTGLMTRSLVRASATVAALDASAASLNLVDPNHETSNLLPVRGDLMQLPFASESFDCVVCANALQHIPGRENQQRVVAELARVTRPGGRVIVSVHGYSVRKRWLGWRQEGSASGPSGPVKFIHRFRVNEFKDVLRSALVVDRVTGASYPLPYRFKLAPIARMAETILSRTSLTAAFGEMLVGHSRRGN